MRILDRVSDLETHVKFLTHHIQQLLQHGGAVVPAVEPDSPAITCATIHALVEALSYEHFSTEARSMP